MGGGVAGLAAAWEARQRGDFERIVVLEAGARWGGKLATTHISLPDGSGILVDEGADAVLARRPEALQLCEELGLTDELTTPAVGRAKVFVGGSMQFLPARTALGVPFDCEDPDVAAILGPAGVEELRQHDAVDHPALTEDTAIGPLLRARLGPTMVERIVGPLVGGINAGDIDRLSTAAVVPAIFTAAQRGGSLTAAVASAAAPNDGPVFVALRGGMERLIGRLVEVLDQRGVELRLNAPVTEISAARRGARLRTLTEDVDADATVITTPA
ncbi:MAG: protoporphyrinogen/coproporphyrinogen oxidase, partial [Actinomycetes bacterium]